MRGTRISIASAAWFCAALAHAAPADYFPLQAGNQWVYRAATGSETWSVAVTGVDTIDGRQYTVVRGFPGGELRLRMEADGTLYLYDTDVRREKIWAEFGAAEGGTWNTGVDPCNETARLVSKNASFSGPIGAPAEVIEIGYPPAQCADAGLGREFFAPGIGLARREVVTIAGPRVYDLIYARIGEVNVFAQKEVSFTLSLDRTVYVANLMPPLDPVRSIPVMTARMRLSSTNSPPVELTFPSGQNYDLVIRDEKGNVVYQWSRGKAFTMIFRQEEFGPGEKNFAIEVRLATADGGPLAAGKYTAEAWLATQPKQYIATAGFEIQHVF